MRKSVVFIGLALPCLLGAQNPQSDPRSTVTVGGPKEKKDKPAKWRTLQGTITDADGKPLRDALVTLTNESTHERLTYFTKDGGHYIFDGLSFTTDYKVVAQYKDEKSSVRKLTQYDRTPKVVWILAVGPEQKVWDEHKP